MERLLLKERNKFFKPQGFSNFITVGLYSLLLFIEPCALLATASSRPAWPLAPRPLVSRPAPDFTEIKSFWYVVKLEETPVGYIREETKEAETAEGPILLTISRSKLTIRRLGAKVELSSVAEYEETRAGELRRVYLSLKLSDQETITKAAIGEGEITVIMRSGEREFSQKISFSGRLLGPEGIRLLTLSSLCHAGEEVDFQTYSPEMNMVVHGIRRAESWEELSHPALAPSVTALRVAEVIKELPTKRTLWLNEDGLLLQSRETSPLGEMTVLLSTEKEALEAAAGTVITEIPFQSALVRANVRLPSARLIEGATLRLRHRRPELGFPELPGPYQKILSREGDTITVEIRRPERRLAGKAEGSHPSPEAASELKEFLEANAYINPEDPLIQEVLRQVAPGARSDWEKALRLRDWVSENIAFDPGIVFAPSSEVIRQRRGTCVSFAILLTTLARAAGIPARFLLGYVYLNGVWGGHAWAELYLDGSWLPFDAAIPSPDVADAARLALVASSLNQGLGECLKAGLQVFSSVEIEIIDYMLGRKVFAAPGKIYEVKGDKYHNPGLGLMVSKPSSYEFRELDKVWPENTLLVMADNHHEISLRQHTWRPVSSMEAFLRSLAGSAFSEAKLEKLSSADKAGFSFVAPDAAAAFFFRGTDLWEVFVRGPAAGRLLRQTLDNIVFAPLPPIQKLPVFLPRDKLAAGAD